MCRTVPGTSTEVRALRRDPHGHAGTGDGRVRPATFPHHEVNAGGTFAEGPTGLDHIAFNVATRADLDTWAQWLDEQQVVHSAVNDVDTPMPYSTLIFRDPDNIQLELFFMVG